MKTGCSTLILLQPVIYTDIFRQYTKLTETYLEKNDIKKAKRSLGDIFEHLSDIKKI